jgi:hypothetical protein
MGLLTWITRAVSRDLDRRVSGAEGTAQARFDRLADEAPLRAQARLGGVPRGAVRLRARGDEPEQAATGEREVALDLGPGRPWRGGQVTAEADVAGGTAGALVTLTVEISGGDAETYSVEARADQQGRARLSLSIELG